MKSRLILLLVPLVLVLCLASCSPSSGASVQASCDDFMKLGTPAVISKNTQVSAGSSFTVTLCSNRTTGFQWSESAQISDQTVVRQTGHKFEPPKGGLVGAAGQEVWTFEALKKGTSTISMEYSRPWEGGEKGTWKFNLTIVVK
ncbi:MAG: protease inhibitor I42 family protein [Chloroflexi bacterium]|nr:protease inhibitor I42 family protein [Chloroflexota bacterium]